jgi:hypothetical protein
MSSRFCLPSVDDGDDQKARIEVGNIQKKAADKRQAISSSLDFVRIANTSAT